MHCHYKNLDIFSILLALRSPIWGKKLAGQVARHVLRTVLMVKDLYTTHKFRWVTPQLLWQGTFYRSEKPQTMSSKYYSPICEALKWDLHLPAELGLTVHPTLCQLLWKTGSSCTIFCLIYVSTGREGRWERSGEQNSVFLLFFVVVLTINLPSLRGSRESFSIPSTRDRPCSLQLLLLSATHLQAAESSYDSGLKHPGNTEGWQGRSPG